MLTRTNNSDFIERERELYSLFKSQDIRSAANRLCDFISDFSPSKELRIDSIVFCNRASNIYEFNKRRKFTSFKEYQDRVTELLYDMMEQVELVVSDLRGQQAA